MESVWRFIQLWKQYTLCRCEAVAEPEFGVNWAFIFSSDMVHGKKEVCNEVSSQLGLLSNDTCASSQCALKTANKSQNTNHTAVAVVTHDEHDTGDVSIASLAVCNHSL